MRKPIIAGNWKMHKTCSEAVKLVQDLSSLVEDVKDVEIVVCPPFTALQSIATTIEADQPNIALGAQNVYFEAEGAFTGEISPLMLKELNTRYVVVGHSERRQYFGETDEGVNKKAKAVLEQEMSPIVCVGESLEEREQENTNALIEKQVSGALGGLKENQVTGIVVAYEPIWAIGTGKSATAQDANDVARYIRALIGSQFSPGVAKEVRIQYGGSVKPDNISDFMAEPDIDGALVGGASLEAESFAGIVKYKNS